jgi:phosphatidylglycerol:prolipoprotein diacylglycerol transferase
MHPTLFHLPLPSLRVPLAALALVAALVSLVVLIVAARRGRRDVVLLGALGLGISLFAWFSRRGMDLVWGSFSAPAWGFCFGLALSAGALLTFFRATRAGVERAAAASALLFAVLLGVVGARLSFALGHLGDERGERGLVALFGGPDYAGLEIAGGLPFALAGVALVFRRDRAVLSFLDAAAPALGLGVLLTRLGCYLEGCDFGVPLRDGSGRMASIGTFPPQSPAWVKHVLERDLSPNAGGSLPVHPTQLYEAGGGLLLVALVVVAGRRFRLAPGQLALIALAGFIALRLGVDLFRDDRVHVVTFRIALLALPFALLYVRRLSPAGER